MFANLPVHFLAYSGLFGVTCYQSFYNGFVSYKALPLEMFSRLQHRVFPGYFVMQTVLTSILLLTPPFALKSDGAASLVTALGGALSNLLFVMPTSQKVASARLALVEKEGKSYKDPTASDEMKALNKHFAKYHRASMLLNFALILAVFYYGYYFTSRLTIKAI